MKSLEHLFILQLTNTRSTVKPGHVRKLPNIDIYFSKTIAYKYKRLLDKLYDVAITFDTISIFDPGYITKGPYSYWDGTHILPGYGLLRKYLKRITHNKSNDSDRNWIKYFYEPRYYKH